MFLFPITALCSWLAQFYKVLYQSSISKKGIQSCTKWIPYILHALYNLAIKPIHTLPAYHIIPTWMYPCQFCWMKFYVNFLLRAIGYVGVLYIIDFSLEPPKYCNWNRGCEECIVGDAWTVMALSLVAFLKIQSWWWLGVISRGQALSNEFHDKVYWFLLNQKWTYFVFLCWQDTLSVNLMCLNVLFLSPQYSSAKLRTLVHRWTAM